MAKVLLVHGYPVSITENGGVTLGPLARAVCEEAFIRPEYDMIVCLGGWDVSGASPTIGEAMRDKLIFEGLSPTKVYAQADIPELRRYMPPRDTAEEAVLVEKLMKVPMWRAHTFHVMAGHLWMWRLRRIYRFLGMCLPTIAVRAQLPLKMVLLQLIAYLFSLIDPLGTGNTFAGRAFRKNREERTLNPSRGQPFLP